MNADRVSRKKRRAPHAMPVLLVVFGCLLLRSASAAELVHYESFDQPRAGRAIQKPAIRGQAAWFLTSQPRHAALQIDLTDKLPRQGWTIALWQLIEEKEWLAAPTDNLLTLRDGDGRKLVSLSKSGGLLVYQRDRTIHLDCFDALYWVRGSREHLTLTWDSEGGGVRQPRGMLRAYWKARPYAALAIDLDRSPATLEIGASAAGLGVDELFVFDQPLSLRSIWELMRFSGRQSVAELVKQLTRREALEAARPTAERRAAWARRARTSPQFEAEADPGSAKLVRSPGPPKAPHPWHRAGSNNASTASGRACVEPGKKPLTFKINAEQAGPHAIAVRYCLPRKMHALWPQNSSARTPWTENFCVVDVQVDGRALPAIKLYPTGTYSGHAGDVEPWAWKTLAAAMHLKAGPHTVRLTWRKGLAQPIYDVLMLSDKPGPEPKHPRRVDAYRIPPSWWVRHHRRSVTGDRRMDTYKVLLRNRCEEPCSYEVLAGSEKLRQQRVRVSPPRVALKPLGEAELTVVFQSPAALQDNSEWANIYLWNEDVALRQKYRLWNRIPPADFRSRKHPVLTEPPDPNRQTALRAWLRTRDPSALTPDLRRWTEARNYKIAAGSPVRGFPQRFDRKRLHTLDDWMKMSAADIEQYLPDGPAEFNGYGSGWERTGVEYAGVWHKMPQVTSISPAGDIDLVTAITVEGPPQKGKKAPYRKTYRDAELLCCLRDTRWATMMGHRFYGAAPHGETQLGRAAHSGVTLLAEAYYLTGDKAYARKAYQMLRIFARKYTHLTKHFYFTLHREDRDWWGGRIGGRYLSKFGPRYYHALGVYVLDLIWDGLTAEERAVIEHNVIRWGMYEAMSGPLFERPEYFAAVNKEDMPFLTMGRVLGDPAPRQGLKFFYDVYRDVVLPDGIHKCSLGSYGGVGGYVTFLKKLSDLGLDVRDDPALRKLFSAHPSFIFSGGGFPNIDDGGGVNLNGLGAGFGSPSPAQYAWAKKLFGDPDLDRWPTLIQAAQRVNNAPPQTKAAVIAKEYQQHRALLEHLWPPVYIAPVKGLAILRNRQARHPIDWKEVIFDYGKHGGRSHGHAAKLATIPSFNGQITSMEYGYGMLQPVGPGFHTRSYAHNVVVADGKDQYGSSAAVQVGQLRESHSDAAVQWIDADSRRIYSGIYMRRTVFAADFGLVDLYLCRSDQPHQYDWMFHSFGAARAVNVALTASKLAAGGPLTFARNPRTVRSNKQLQVIWENAPRTKPPAKSATALLHEKAFVRLWSLPAADTTLALFGIQMTEPVGKEIDYAMLRRSGRSTVFATVQEPYRTSQPATIAAVTRPTVRIGEHHAQDREAYAVEVRRTAGNRQVFLVNYLEKPVTIGNVTTDAAVACWKLDAQGNASQAHYSKGRSFRIQGQDPGTP